MITDQADGSFSDKFNFVNVYLKEREEGGDGRERRSTRQEDDDEPKENQASLFDHTRWSTSIQSPLD